MRLEFLSILLLLFPVSASASQISFTNVTKSAGIRWEHVNGATPEKFLIETMGGGGAFLDYDNDGWMDIYLVNSGGHAFSEPGTSGRNALYKNQGDGTFLDVTNRAQVAGRGYGNGVAVADYDNNGFADLYVTAFGKNILYRNRGDGTFEDVTQEAGVGVGQWSTSAAFFDADQDGDLDLFVCVYLEWSYDLNVWCGDRSENGRSYCDPDVFSPVSSVFFLNNGNGTFTDATRESHLQIPGKALAVVASDFDLDGDMDLYVVNDSTSNFLFLNRGNGQFIESASLAGVADGPDALPQRGMGTDAADFNDDGLPDLVATASNDEPNDLYLNLGKAYFSDTRASFGLEDLGLSSNGFGVRFLDLDLNGTLDLVILNGHPLDNVDLYHAGVEAREAPLILRNRGATFSRPTGLGRALQQKYAGRSLAAGDFDNDGDPDLLFVNNGEGPALLRNDTHHGQHWFGLRLIGTGSNRDAIGSRVTVETNRRTLTREVTGGGSYQAAHDTRLVFGFEAAESVRKILVRWPNGKTRKLPILRLGMYHTARQGAVEDKRRN